MSQNKIRQEILSLFGSIAKSSGAGPVLISGHIGPDGDSLGSQLGLYRFLHKQGIDCRVINQGMIPEKYLFMPDIEVVIDIDDFKEHQLSFSCAVTMECSNLDRIGKVADLVKANCKVVNIDHHKDNSSFGDINLLDFEASAAGEMVYDLIVSSGDAISAEIATNLYVAILTDTGRFHYSSTTAKCLRIASELVEAGANPELITENIYYTKKPEQLRLAGLLLSGMEYMLDNRLCLMTLTPEIFSATGTNSSDTEGMINYTMQAGVVEVGVLFSEISDKMTKVSFRSRQKIDVGALANRFGGGGHHSASGCVIESGLEEARKLILDQVRQRLNGSV